MEKKDKAKLDRKRGLTVQAASPEVEGSDDTIEEQKDSEEGASDLKEKKKKKRIGFHDKKVGTCIIALEKRGYQVSIFS